MDTWLWIGGALLLGAILGVAAGARLWRGNGSDRETVSRLRNEIEEYKDEVSEHFVQTADLVNNLTRSYKAVYDHLEHGAYRLVGEESLRKELDGVDSEPVQLEYIGRRDGADVLGARHKRRTSPPDSAESRAAAVAPATPPAESPRAQDPATQPSGSQVQEPMPGPDGSDATVAAEESPAAEPGMDDTFAGERIAGTPTDEETAVEDSSDEEGRDAVR